AFSLNLEALEGRFYIRTPDQAGGEGIAPVDVKVPSARISIRPESLVRLDIESGRTRVRVQEGSVRIDPFGPGGPTPVFLGRMEQIRLSTEGDPGYPGYFTTASDDGLERYNRFRDNRFMEQDRPEPLDEPLVGQDELARNGSWVFIGGVSYWRPYVSVGWRPYSVGHWAWHTGFGWTWISGDPFGYVTFHYGRWHHDSYYGWVWFPGYTYAPAHVHWISVGPYYAWAPLGIYGYPVSTGYIHFTLHGGYGIDLNVWSYSHVDYFVGIRKHHRYSAHKHFRPVERRLFTDHPSGKVEAVGIGTRPGTAGGERSFASPGPGKKRTVIRTPDTRRKAMETEIRNRAVTPREFSKNLRPESRSFETSRQTTLIDPSRAGKQEFKQSSRPAPQIQKDTTPKSERRAAPPPELRRAPKNTDRS
ncbi:MAG TPA: DUF6600 domain-containing protein, partial [Nitrospiria bacterium]|nr:DUF6600 domain-containing protein [Nitrospiria bacterium]